MMGVYDESLQKFHTESRVSLERDQEAELSRRFKESMQGQELTGIDLGDYDTPVLGNLDYAQGTLSPQYIKPFMQAIGTRDAATGESLLGPMTVKPEEPGRWSKAKKYIAGQVESVLKMYGEGALQTLGAAEDIRNHVLDTSADLVIALGGDESEVMRGKSNIPQSDSLAYSIPRDLMSFAGKYAVARGALLKTVGKPVSLWGKFGLESAAGAVADFMQDPRTDSLIDAVSSVMGEERYIAELYKESPLMARTALAGEGSVIGAAAEGVMRGIPAAVQRLATYADDLEQVGVDRMRRSRSTLNAGIDPEGLRGLVEYFTGKILKGANELTEDLRAEVMPVGATDDQVAGAFRQALEVVQLGEDRAIASPIRPDQPVELSFSEIFGGKGAAREAQDVAGGVSPIRPGQSEELGFTDIFGDTTAPSMISTRFPTAIKATEDPLQESLTVGLEPAMRDTAAFKHNVDLMSQYDNYVRQGARGAPAKAEQLIDHMKTNLLKLFDDVPPEIRERSKLWYVGANKIANDLAGEYGISPESASAVMAALSPQKDWFMNVSLGQRVIDIHSKGGDWNDKMAASLEEIAPKIKNRAHQTAIGGIQGKAYDDLTHPVEKALWIRVYDEGLNDRSYQVVTPEGEFAGAQTVKGGDPAIAAWSSLSTISNAVSVLDDPSVENISRRMGGMHKVRNFYNNIVAPTSDRGDVTIDTHAVAAALFKPLAGSDKEVLHNFGGGVKGQRGPANSAITGLQGTYPIYAEAYRRAAADRGVLPREMQSVTSEAVRGLFTDVQKTPQNKAFANSVWKRYKKGEISQQEAQNMIKAHFGGVNAPDWHE